MEEALRAIVGRRSVHTTKESVERILGTGRCPSSHALGTPSWIGIAEGGPSSAAAFTEEILGIPCDLYDNREK